MNGEVSSSTHSKCANCSGTGTIRNYFGDAFGSFAFGPCGKCKGSGKIPVAENGVYLDACGRPCWDGIEQGAPRPKGSRTEGSQ